MTRTGKDRMSLKASLFYNSFGLTVYLFLQWSLTVLVVAIRGFNDAGRFALAVSITSTFHSMALFGMRNYQISDVKDVHPNEVYIYSRVITGILSFAFCAIYTFIALSDSVSRTCILMYMVFKVSEAFADVFHGMNQKCWRLDIVAGSLLFRGIVSSVGFLVVLSLTGRLIAAISTMAVLSMACVLIFDAGISNRLTSFHLSARDLFWRRREIGRLLVICLPMMMYLFAFSGLLMYPRQLLQRMFGDDLLGIYTSVSVPALVVQVAASFLFNPLVPLLAERWAERDLQGFRQKHHRIILAILILGAAALAVAAAFGRPVLILLFGEKIRPYTGLLLPAVLIATLTALVYYLDTILVVFRDGFGLIACNALALAAGIAVSHWLVPIHKAQGVNYTLIGVMLLLSILLTVRIRQGAQHITVSGSAYVQQQ